MNRFVRSLALAAALAGLASTVPSSPAHGQDAAEGGSDSGHEWPLGLPAGGAGFRGKDLYNLGMLGAKGRDPAREPGPSFGQGMRRSSSADAPKDADIGPNRLLLDVLCPGGPAEQAGLRVGDVIVGAKRAFKDGSLAPLAAALIDAESGKGKGVITLLVERAGSTSTEKVDVAIPQGGKEAKDPVEDPHRDAIFRRACAWLAEQQASNGGYRETLSGSNGAVVQTSLAGLAWLAGGSDLKQGPYSENVKKAVEFVTANLPGMGSFGARGGTSDRSDEPSWDQSNWGYAHAAIFLGELHARTPDPGVKETLIECGRTLAERQEKSGGWAHGPGGPNALGYVELNIVSGLALSGIGLAGQAGYEVPEDVLQKAEEYLEASGGGDGGVAYSDKSGQRGQGNIGRTAGAWLGFGTLGLGKDKWGQKMGRYVESHAGDMLGGHASLMQHFLLAGVAAHASGKKARKAYWEVARDEMTLARAPDGSFQPRPWHETLSMGSNSDVSFGVVWTTAAWAIVLGCEPSKERPGLPAWMSL